MLNSILVKWTEFCQCLRSTDIMSSVLKKGHLQEQMPSP